MQPKKESAAEEPATKRRFASLVMMIVNNKGKTGRVVGDEVDVPGEVES